MSQYTLWSIGESGNIPFDSTILDPYFLKDDHYPYLIMVDNEIAGFFLIRKYPYDSSYIDVGQFFILRKFKGKGVGISALKIGRELYPGKWLIRVLENNSGAREFWLKAIEKTNPGNFEITRELYENRVSMDFIRFS